MNGWSKEGKSSDRPINSFPIDLLGPRGKTGICVQGQQQGSRLVRKYIYRKWKIERLSAFYWPTWIGRSPGFLSAEENKMKANCSRETMPLNVCIFLATLKYILRDRVRKGSSLKLVIFQGEGRAISSLSLAEAPRPYYARNRFLLNTKSTDWVEKSGLKQVYYLGQSKVVKCLIVLICGRVPMFSWQATGNMWVKWIWLYRAGKYCGK